MMVGMKMKNLYITLLMALLMISSGCMGKDNKNIIEEPNVIYYYNTQYWNDSHQFNDAAMLVGYTNNTTMNYELSNFSSNITIDLECEFTSFNGAQGYFQIEISDNNTIIYQNSSSESIIWYFISNISSSTIQIVIQSEGFDSDPLTEYADYFVVYIENDVYATINGTSN